jgi:hypothetical protein
MTPCFQDIVFDKVDLEKELGIEPLLANELRELITSDDEPILPRKLILLVTEFKSKVIPNNFTISLERSSFNEITFKGNEEEIISRSVFKFDS